MVNSCVWQSCQSQRIALKVDPTTSVREALALPRLAIDKDFLDDYSKLEKSVQNAVKDAIDKFAEHTHAGLHLEKLQKAKDDRIRTIRIDQFWRGVVLAPGSGNTYSLIRVLPHDKAIDYAATHRFTVNPARAGGGRPHIDVDMPGAISMIVLNSHISTSKMGTGSEL
jgi:hypothetical protein